MIIPLFGLGQSGKSRTVTSQGHLNLYAEITEDADKSRVVYYNTPGLTLFSTFGDTPTRGSIEVGDYMYHVHRGTFWQVDNAGTKTSRGTLTTTSGRVALSYNGTQIVMTDGTSMYCYTIATTAFATVGSGLFTNPLDVTYQDSYFIACFATGRYEISGQNDGLTWSALDFANAESNPDGLVRIMADHGEIVLCGEKTIEFAGNSGATDFPYTIQRGTTLEFGLAAPWSLVKYNDSLAGLFKSAMGQVQVMMMRGHALQAISTKEIDDTINGYATVADATALAYMLGGHPMYQINFPTAGKSWLYDASTGMWSALESGLLGGRHRAEILVDYLNKPRVTDYENGNIYTIDPDVYADNGVARPCEIISRHFFGADSRLAVSELQVYFEAGTGLVTGQGSDPQVMLQVSRDGGFTWGNELWRSIGAIGKYLARARWTRLGAAYDFVFKLRVTDPVKVVISAGSIKSEKR